jgi:Uma2 family endonuclease
MMIAFGHKIEIDKNPNNLTNEELFDFCVMNKSLHIERDKNQNLLIMAPVGGGSGFREKNFIFEIESWIRKKNSGISFSSSTGFFLPNGAMRSPDACWVSAERWATVAIEQQEKFPPIAPDFVVEVRSKTDGLQTTKDKMQEWIENGVRLAWLIDVHNQQTFIYRENGSIEIIEGFDKKLNGENIMTGFTFDLNQLEIK